MEEHADMQAWSLGGLGALGGWSKVFGERAEVEGALRLKRRDEDRAWSPCSGLFAVDRLNEDECED